MYGHNDFLKEISYEHSNRTSLQGKCLFLKTDIHLPDDDFLGQNM